MTPLDYMSGPDAAQAARAERFSGWYARGESITRWLALVALIAIKWEWFSLQSPLSLFASLAAIVLVPLWCLAVAASALQSRVAPKPLRWNRRLCAIAVCGFLGVTALLTQWPFYAAFFVSRPFLNRLADDAAAGKNVSGWHWAGAWIIRDVRVEPDGSVGMYFDWSGSGWCGVVRYSPSTTTPVGSNNGRRPLGGQWELVDED
jgi:hypothetical protein